MSCNGNCARNAQELDLLRWRLGKTNRLVREMLTTLLMASSNSDPSAINERMRAHLDEMERLQVMEG